MKIPVNENHVFIINRAGAWELACVIFTFLHTGVKMDHKRVAGDEYAVSAEKRTACSSQDTYNDGELTITLAAAAAPSNDLACFELAYRLQDSFLCPRNRLASVNRDVAELVRKALDSPKLVTQIESHALIDYLWGLDLGLAEHGWRRMAASSFAVDSYAAVRLDERTIVWSGGEDTDGELVDICGAFCWRSCEVLTRHALPCCLHSHEMAVLDGCLCVLGGQDVADETSAAFWIENVEHSWKRAADMPLNCVPFEVASISSSEIVAALGACEKLTQCHAYDAHANIWQKQADFAGFAHGSAAIDRSFFVYDRNPGTHGFHVFDQRANVWTRCALRVKPTLGSAVVTVDDTTIAVFGGLGPGDFGAWCISGDCPIETYCSVYDVRADRWRAEPAWDLPEPMVDFKVCCTTA